MIIIVMAGVILLVFVAIAICRRKQPVPMVTSEFRGITVRCPVSDTELPIEKIWFRCSGEHLGADSRIACENHIRPISFDEMIAGYREFGSSNNIERVSLLRYRLNLPKKLRPEHRDLVLNVLMEAKCSNCGLLFQPCCHCQGKEALVQEHRLDFEFTLSDIIATTGPVAVGQTVYFHMLKFYLENKYIGNYKAHVKLEPTETRIAVNESLFRMIRERILPSPTYIAERWEFHFTISPAKSGWPAQPIKFLMYDTSGSIPTNMNSMEKYFGYFTFSDSLVLFLEPYSIQELAKNCHSHIGMGAIWESPDPIIMNHILDNIIEFLGARVYSQIYKYPVNLAVVITKCDEYMHMFSNELKAELNSVHLPGAQKPNFEPLDKISMMFKEWLKRFDSPHSSVASFISRADNQFAQVGYFPISSLGTGVMGEAIEETYTYVDFISTAKPLDDDTGNAFLGMSPTNQPPIPEKRFTFMLKYQGDLNPFYLDYPILWLHKHRRRK